MAYYDVPNDIFCLLCFIVHLQWSW